MSALADHFRAGSGPPLLLIPGFSTTWRTWGPLPESLAAEFDVLAPTLPGHVGGPGLTEPRTIPGLADWVEALLDEVGWDRPHIAGFSLGGWLALEMAKRGRAASVTAFAPAGGLLWCGPRERRRFLRQFKVNRALVRAMQPVMDRVLASSALRRIALRDMMADGSLMPPDEAAQGLRESAATPAYDDILRSFGRDQLVDLDRVTVPVHVWWGKRDRIHPLKHARYFEEHLPNATFEYVDDAGHVPFWEAAESVIAAIRATALKASNPADASSRA
jgi:pimeloyl-ACP methyl ester carboxylesterase